MIKTALKNFFGNLVNLFIPMGIIYLFLLLAIFVFLSVFLQSSTEMIEQLVSLIEDSSGKSNVTITEFLTFAVDRLDMSGGFFDAIGQIFDGDWIGETVRGFFKSLGAGSGDFEGRLNEIVETYVGKLGDSLSVSVVFMSLGIILGFYATGYAVRRRSAKRGFKRTIIAHTVVPIAETLIIVGCLLLLNVIRYYSLLVLIVSLIFMGIVNLTSSWILFGKGKIPFNRIVKGKNILLHIAVIGIIGVLVLAIAAGLFMIDPLLAILLMIPILVYSLVILDINTDSYVSHLAEKYEGATEKEKA